jgi:hypothetical protein
MSGSWTIFKTCESAHILFFLLNHICKITIILYVYLWVHGSTSLSILTILIDWDPFLTLKNISDKYLLNNHIYRVFAKEFNKLMAYLANHMIEKFRHNKNINFLTKWITPHLKICSKKACNLIMETTVKS